MTKSTDFYPSRSQARALTHPEHTVAPRWRGLYRAGVLMAVPSSAGALGMYMALASLLPWTVFSVLIARRLFQLGRAS